MNVQPLLADAGEHFGVPVRKNSYAGNAKSYLTWVYADERPVVYADDLDRYDLTEIALHWFSTAGSDTAAQKRQMRRYLRGKGFTIQSTAEMVESDTGINHVIVYATIESFIEEVENDGESGL